MKNKARISSSILVFLFLLAQSVAAQKPRQLVKNTKQLVCQYRDGATAESAMTACQHHVKVHREGYVVVKAELRNDGQVICTCQDPENKEAYDLVEASMVGEITCPPHSSEASTGTEFRWQESMCECDQDYVAQGNKCVPAKEAQAANKSRAKPAAAKGRTTTTKPKDVPCQCPAGANLSLEARLTQLVKITPEFYLPSASAPNAYQEVKIKKVSALLKAGQVLVVTPASLPGLAGYIAQHKDAKRDQDNAAMGTISEQAAQLFLRSMGCDSVFEGKVNSSDNGFDILTFSPCVAAPAKIRIVESKQVDRRGDIALSATNRGVQMSDAWEAANIGDLSRAPAAVNPAGSRVGRAMQKNHLLIEKYVSAIYDGNLILLRLANF
ncbi:hypothetical protein [Hymenobacter negativus]|uniref:Restriction endonuclease type IV Mrr domain-containing protein n=1 Tax=Hymenobacter negativus TaxID=2795026 RepID=A0ABS3QNT6_9BACT|nr:hypothetical protein [Hymenobacter negativus]MBO2012942.1 hypothetical protein [Hymenobacter negativus]